MKKALQIKAVWSKYFNFPSLLFSLCSESSQQKVFWKISVSIFFVEILEKHKRRIFFFHIVVSWRATTLFLQRLLKSQVFTNGVSLSLSWQLCRAAILKNAIFSSAASVAASVKYTVDYIMQHHYGSIYLAACVLTHLSLLFLVY